MLTHNPIWGYIVSLVSVIQEGKTESKVDSTKVVEKSVSPTASLNDFSDYDII